VRTPSFEHQALVATGLTPRQDGRRGTRRADRVLPQPPRTTEGRRVKVGPSSNYLVRVLREEWERPDRPELYRDVFEVTLNHAVTVMFVPDVSAVAPPWDAGRLPAGLDDLATVEEARLASVLFSSYAVTPNADLAGTVERLTSPPGDGDPALVRYVTPAEFERYLADLDRLNHVAGSLHQVTLRVDDLRDHEVIQFLEREVVAAPWLRAADARMLGRPEVGPSQARQQSFEAEVEALRSRVPVDAGREERVVTVSSNLLALALGFLTILVAVGLIAVGVPPVLVLPIAVYGLSGVSFLLARRLGDVGLIAGNTLLVLGAIVLGVTAGFANVDLDAEDPRTAPGWGTFVAALVVPYGLYGVCRAMAERREDRRREARR
jgi:hypothetical protein